MSGLCRSCGRPFSPTHDADAPGPTTRHPFLVARKPEPIPPEPIERARVWRDEAQPGRWYYAVPTPDGARVVGVAWSQPVAMGCAYQIVAVHWEARR